MVSEAREHPGKLEVDAKRSVDMGAEERARPNGATAAPGPASRGLGALRRQSVVLLVGGGAFLSALAVLLRIYVYAQLALIPAETDLSLALHDEEAAFLDTTTWEVVADAHITRTTYVAARSSPGNPGWSAWWVRTETTAGDHPIDHVDRRVVVDRSTGAAVNCCGEHVGGDRAVRQAGLVLYWPAGEAWEEHPFYDADIRAAPVMQYDGTEEIAGVETWRYVQTVEETQLADSARSVPAEALGSGGEGLVEAARWLELTRTVWVEPESGWVVHATEERHETLRAASGEGEATWLEADLELGGEQIADNAQAAANQAMLLRAVRDWIPLAFIVLGPVLIAAGLLRAWRS